MRSAFNYGTSLDSGYYRCPRRTTCIGEAVACLPIADSRIKLKTKHLLETKQLTAQCSLAKRNSTLSLLFSNTITGLCRIRTVQNRLTKGLCSQNLSKVT